jgi:hypothetical protein
LVVVLALIVSVSSMVLAIVVTELARSMCLARIAAALPSYQWKTRRRFSFVPRQVESFALCQLWANRKSTWNPVKCSQERARMR